MASRLVLRHTSLVMRASARQRYSFREYVQLEEYSNVRHEFVNGCIYAMAGGTPRHAALAARIIQRLGAQLAGGPCEVFTSDLRIRVSATGLATYPDVSVVCGRLETDPDDAASILNPTVLVEVLSDSTEDYDCGEKLEHYRQIPTARAIMLLSHREPLAELWQRDPSGVWSKSTVRAGQTIDLAPIGCTVAIDDLYRDLPVAAERVGD